MKSFKIKVFIGIAIICGLIFSPGCEKVDTDISYDIVAYLDLPEVDTLIPYSRYVKIFAHYKDTLDYEVYSYEYAADGIVARKGTDVIIETDWAMEGRYDGDEGVIKIGPFGHGPVMLVAYDTERHAEYQSKMYAWRNIAVEPGVSNVRMALVFKPEEAISNDNKQKRGDIERIRIANSYRWQVANDNPYVKPSTGGNTGVGEDKGADGAGE